MNDTSEREDLESLLMHPGWLRFRAELKAFWDTDVADRVRDAASQSDDQTVVHKLRQALAARDAILNALRWPEQRISQLKRVPHENVVTLSRRGTL